MVESANRVRLCVAVAGGECQRDRRGRRVLATCVRRAGEQLVREQPAARREHGSARPRRASTTSTSPRPAPSRRRSPAAAPQAPRAGSPRSVRRPSTTASAAARARRGPPAARAAARAVPAGGASAADVAVEPGRVPAAERAIERVRARADRLVRPALPVGEVVPALVARRGPVADLVAAEPRLRETIGTAWWYCAAARSSSWRGRAPSRQRRAPGRGRQVVARRAR